MRGLRSTIALTVILAGLGAYIYFVTSKKPDSKEPAKERVFAALDGTKVDGIQVKSESGDTTSLKKGDGVWKITAPLTASADDNDVSSIATNLSTLDVTRIV